MIGFADRVEFGSGQWMIAAQEELSRITAEVGLPGGTSASVCEAYAGAPMHLGCPGGVAAYQVRLAGGEASLIPGAADDVDLKVTGDYHAVLPLKMAVFSDSGSEYRAHRENSHRAGADAVVAKGQISDPVVAEVLHRFHNAMARRTVDSEDLTARIAAQGLSAKVAQLEDQGYTILENAITEEFADELRGEIMRLIGDLEPEQTNILANGQRGRLLMQGRLFEEAALHPWVLTLAEYLCGKDFNIHQSLGIARSTGGSLPLHDDYLLVREPFPPYCLETTSIWALEDFDMAAGPTAVVPGSHRKGHHPPDNYFGRIEDHPHLNLEMPKGSIGFWNGATWHAAKVRQAAGVRVTLHNSFCRLFMRDIDRYTMSIDPAILDRNPPVMTTMTGHDSIYSMSTEAGPNYAAIVPQLSRFES